MRKKGPLSVAVFRSFPLLQRSVTASVLLALLLMRAPAFSTNLYWDTNGATTGSANSTVGVWGSSNFWNTDSTGANGGALDTSTTIADDLVISAGSNAAGANTITISGAHSAQGITFANGTVTLAGASTPVLTPGSLGLTMSSTLDGPLTLGASLTNLILSASQTWANNSSQSLSVNSATHIIGSATAGNTYTLTLGGNCFGALVMAG